jgi:transcriptional regulator with XRE-family HTH domain
VTEQKRETLAARIKRLREALDVSQEVMAQRARTKLVSYRNWEYDHRLPSLGAASLVAKALGVPLQELADCVEGLEDGRNQPRAGRVKKKQAGETASNDDAGGNGDGEARPKRRRRRAAAAAPSEVPDVAAAAPALDAVMRQRDLPRRRRVAAADHTASARLVTP